MISEIPCLLGFHAWEPANGRDDLHHRCCQRCGKVQWKKLGWFKRWHDGPRPMESRMVTPSVTVREIDHSSFAAHNGPGGLAIIGSSPTGEQGEEPNKKGLTEEEMGIR